MFFNDSIYKSVSVWRLLSHKISASYFILKNVYVKPESRTFDCLRLTTTISFMAARELPLAFPTPRGSAICYGYWTCHAFLYNRKSLLRIPQRRDSTTKPKIRNQQTVFLKRTLSFQIKRCKLRKKTVYAITTVSQDIDYTANPGGVLFLWRSFLPKIERLIEG